MELTTNIIIYLSIAIVIGIVLGVFIQKRKNTKQKDDAKAEVKEILNQARREADRIKSEKILQAKERFIELKSEHEKVIFQREKKISEVENRLREKENKLGKELNRNKNLSHSLDQKNESLEKRLEKLEVKQKELDSSHEIQVVKLESISGLSADEAKKELISSLQKKAESEAMAFAQQSLEEAKLTVEQEAKKIIINTIQRIGTEESIENCVSVFNLDSDDVKGRIIGREGRNIRAIEAVTGVEIIVDDTPEAIILSCFDPVRREIARLSLHRLVTDGRIHPARIEEVVNKITKQIHNEIVEVGKRTVIDLGVHGLNPELIKIIGRMKYRSSYGKIFCNIPERLPNCVESWLQNWD